MPRPDSAVLGGLPCTSSDFRDFRARGPSVPKFIVGGWTWVCHAATTIRQGVKTGTDAKVLKAKLSLIWTGPYKDLG